MKRLSLEDVEKKMNYISIFKTIVNVGDSLSSGELVSVDKDGKYGYNDMFEYSWIQDIANKAHVKAYNFTRGGMTAKEYMESFADANDFFNPKYQADCYIIALGVNDLLHPNRECGTIDDIDINDYHNNKDTFAGWFGRIISKYKEISPRAYFFLVTCPQTLNEKNIDSWDKEKQNHQKLMYDLTIIFDNTFVLDLYQYAPIYDQEITKKYMMNGHMTPAGYLFSSSQIQLIWENVIEENLEKFNDAGFVKTNLYSKQPK